MSETDLVVRGATVVDGSGLPPYTADVAVRAGTITQVGRVDERGEVELDADGGVLAPGSSTSTRTTTRNCTGSPRRRRLRGTA